MNHLASCLRCGTPLTSGNAQAVDPSVCAGCLSSAPTPPASGTEAAPLRRGWLFAVAAALPIIAAALLLAALPGRPKVEDSNGRAEEAAPQSTPKSIRRGIASLPADSTAIQDEGPATPVRADHVSLAPALARPADRKGELPAAPKAAAAVEKKVKKGIKRRTHASEEELRKELAGAQEVGLGASAAGLFRAYTAHVAGTKDLSGSKGLADASPILQARPELATLPLRDGPACSLRPKAAAELGALSRKMRVYLDRLAPPGPDGRRHTSSLLRDQMYEDLRGKKLEWLRAEAVPTITQMLMAEEAGLRRLLVDVLAAIKGKPATVALARRAAFDLDPEVRAAAVEALKGRPADQWRPVLLEALRYPWAPPADFAAEALVRLKDKDAIPDLVSLLKMPPAGRPYTTGDRRVKVREVVRINHRANCLLCHPPSLTGNEPVLGEDPFQTIARSTRTQQSGGQATAATTQTSTVPLLIRADITFLRQDFSATLALPNPCPPRPLPGQPPPPVARFDFVVRTRTLKAAEKKKWDAIQDKDDPQRDAVLFALRELSGRDEGDSTEAWVKAYPLAEAEVRSRRLADALVRADGLEQTALLTRYRDGEGVEHAWALARAIPRLGGSTREVARLALANRLARSSAAELRHLLKDRDVEVKRAAVRACGEKNDRDLAGDLVALLETDASTAALARAALKKLTGQEWADAAAWRAWLGVAKAE